ncbi:MAG TPA: hypothetical protein ENG83_02020 [Nitrospirae bacterium]|nr:hypothetical protein [Nitrospirota bacterium]HDL19678.1 hypothetical protein [Nitrospirota bacterium]HDZ03082.1 hypothetical protein [Nitrospirota bacterium]
MIIGTRVLYPEEVESRNAELLQISVYRGMQGNLDFMRRSALACRKAGISYVIHPVGYSLLEGDTFKALREMAEWADLALILHDEKTPDGERIEGRYATLFREMLGKLESVTSVSFENATDTRDAEWFWNNFADSVTLDIGHIESSGLESPEFVRSLDESSINKIQFVHMHRNNGLHGGITDHWPLRPGCRELRALEELIKIKPDVSVILELNEVEEISENLALLKEFRDRLQKS